MYGSDAGQPVPSIYYTKGLLPLCDKFSMGIYTYNSLTQQPIKTKLGTHILFSEHTTIITVNIVINNAVLVKQH